MSMTADDILNKIQGIDREQQKKDEAQVILDRIRTQSGKTRQPSVGEQAVDLGETAARGAVTAGEVGLSTLTGAAAAPVAGLAGVGAELIPGGRTGAEAVRDVSEAFTWQPRTRSGQQAMDEIGEVFQKLEQGVDFLATSASDNPLVQTTIKTGLLGLPEAMGLRTGVSQFIDIKKKVKQAEAVADELGVDLNAPDLPDQIIKTADGRTITVKGEGVQDLQNQLRQARREARERLNAQFEEAQGKRAALRPQSAEELELDMKLALTNKSKRTGVTRNFDFEDMPKVKARLGEFEDLARRSAEGEEISINEVFNLRRRINDNRPAQTDASQNAALSVMKKELDEFLQDKLEKDMISGDPDAIPAWKKALKDNEDFKARFDDNETIARIIKDELTQEEVKNLVLGASQVKPEAGRLVGKIKNILGADHPTIDGLRQEVLLPVVEPLLRTTPSFRQFSKNVDRLLRNNPTVVKELTPESLQPLIDLKKVADAAIKTGKAPSFEGDIATMMSRALFGHQIAKAALRVSLAAKGIKLLKGVAGMSQKQALLAEMLGFDPRGPFIPKRQIAAGGIIADQVNKALESVEDESEPIKVSK